MTAETLWTLDELCEQVARGLATDAPEPEDGRVREVPDRRTVRYYTTLGLVDRPAEMRGRTAYYGRKHLCQLLAVKRLQAQGQSLAQVQQALLGLNDDELSRLAGLPQEQRKRRERSRDREAFWSAPPVPAEAPAKAEAQATELQGVRLGPGVVLLIEANREVREEDRETIRRATDNLLELLRVRGLVGPARPDGDAQPAKEE